MFVGTQTHLQVYDVYNNADILFHQVSYKGRGDFFSFFFSKEKAKNVLITTRVHSNIFQKTSQLFLFFAFIDSFPTVFFLAMFVVASVIVDILFLCPRFIGLVFT